MGTSTRWKGPGGGRWRSAGRRLARWNPQRPDADRRLEEIASDHLLALHETMRGDPSAFGLYDATCAAGERLTEAMAQLAQAGPSSPGSFIADLTRQVGGHGGTFTESVLRRAISKTSQQVLEQHPELSEAMNPESADSRKVSSDILCDLFQLFFANTVAEFLHSVVAEHVKLALPVLHGVDPEGRIASWVADRVLELVPNPCEAATEATEIAEAIDKTQSVIGAVQNPVSALPAIARQLVPETVGRILGLVTEKVEAEWRVTS